MSWYETFFDREWLDCVARTPQAAESALPQVEFVVGELGLEPGARVLDLACGHGRHAVELARRGYRVTGLDLSERSLVLAREAAAGLEIEFVHADMRELDYEGEFDAVVNLFTAFGYFEDEAENELVLERVARALKPGGGFLIDVISQPWLMRNFQARDWRDAGDGVAMLEERSYDPFTGRSSAVWTFLRSDGERSQLFHSLRVYTLPELASMLRRAGLEVTGVWGDWEGAAYGLDTPRLIVRAVRPA